jgi:hypothetical protein
VNSPPAAEPVGTSGTWQPLALVTLLAVYLLVLMEWVFFVTKPSFLSILDGQQRTMVVFLAPLPLLPFAGLALAPPLMAATMFKGERSRRLFRLVAFLVPTLVLGSLYLLMVDNFTNTVLGLAIQRSAGWGRIAAAIGVLGLYLLAYRSIRYWSVAVGDHRRAWTWLAFGLLAFSVVPLLTTLARAGGPNPTDTSALYVCPAKRPNILILGSDGLNANHLSCYGYERDTTPFLRSLIPDCLVASNSFSNCCHTTGSLASLLTGRLPTDTGVTYPPDILTGREIYRHLPGILRKLGYHSTQISIRHYGDAYDVNLREGFDTANFRRREAAQSPSRLSRYLGTEAAFLAERILDRIGVRLAHVVGHRSVVSAYEEAAHGDRLAGLSEERRFQGLQEALAGLPEPFFAHAHFMGTHGARFNLLDQIFSAGMDQDSGWMPEFYDDAIREFDRAVGRLLAVLQARGVLENTLVVIYSDHGMKSDSRQRTPLIIRFPGGALAGSVAGNVQCLDIAPTILDYLGVGVPRWMAGKSLLGAPPDPLRPVFSTRFRGDSLERVVPGGPFAVRIAPAGQPFGSMGSLIMVIAQRVYSLDLVGRDFEIHDLPDHTAPVAEADLPGADSAAAMMVAHLASRGYDVSGLVLPLPRREQP